MRVVLDANVLVSGTISPTGMAGRVLGAWRAGLFEACTGEVIINEVVDALTRPDLRERYVLTESAADDFVREIRAAAHLARLPVEPIDVVRDSNDNHVIECAIGCEADLIVTNDDDLLALKGYEGIGIVSIRDFLRTLGLA